MCVTANSMHNYPTDHALACSCSARRAFVGWGSVRIPLPWDFVLVQSFSLSRSDADPLPSDSPSLEDTRASNSASSLSPAGAADSAAAAAFSASEADLRRRDEMDEPIRLTRLQRRPRADAMRLSVAPGGMPASADIAAFGK